jgi:hypothetical protein
MRLRPVVIAAIALAACAYTSNVGAVPPVIQSPTAGDIERGFTGPVTVTWNEAGDMKIVVAGPQPQQTIPVTVQADPAPPTTADYAINPLNAPGTYTITASRADGADAASVVVVVRVNSATILAPTNGSYRFHPWRGPLRVRWASVSQADHTYSVWLDGNEVCSFLGSDLSPGEVTSCMLPSPAALGTREVTAVDATEGDLLDLATVGIVLHLGITSLRVSPERFFPYVRDGYRDRALAHFSLNKNASVVAIVRNARGLLVRREPLGKLRSGSWAWNGRTNSGRRAPVGPYRLILEARALGERKRAARSVWVARGWRKRTLAVTRCGSCGPGRVAASPRCAYAFDVVVIGDLLLACDGGEAAVARWRFRVPATTLKARASIAREILCCEPGSVAFDVEFTRRRQVTVYAGVSGYRAMYILGLRLRYTYRVRI